MIEKNQLIANKSVIKDIFRNDLYDGNVHSFETPSEGLCSYYFVKLKYPYPHDKSLQFSALWKLLEMNQPDFQNYTLFENFRYILDSWNTRKIETRDIKRAKNIMNNCQYSIDDETNRNTWLTNRKTGYYLNNKYFNKNFSPSMTNKILNFKNKGIVINDEWNCFTMLIESNNVCSLFHWETFA